MQEIQEAWVRSLGWEEPLEESMAAHSSQYSCLENPVDRGAWWTVVHRVTKSQTRRSDLAHMHIQGMVLAHSGSRAWLRFCEPEDSL